jgi:hypothetical protein
MWNDENEANRINRLAFYLTCSSVSFLGFIESITSVLFKHYGSHVYTRKNMLILAHNVAQGNIILTTSKVQA